MRILAVADIHGSQYRLNLILKNIDRYSPDLIVICGDITQFGPGELAKTLLDQIPIETLTVTGNIDSDDVKKGIDDSKAINIEMKKIIKKGIPFVGASGTKTDEFKFLEDKKMIDNKTVIVSHVPPYGFQDKIFIGLHGGSKELREIIDKYHPRLVLCGHIHEDPGYAEVNGSIIVNCSMGKRGEGAIIEIDKEITVEMIE